MCLQELSEIQILYTDSSCKLDRSWNKLRDYTFTMYTYFITLNCMQKKQLLMKYIEPIFKQNTIIL